MTPSPERADRGGRDAATSRPPNPLAAANAELILCVERLRRARIRRDDEAERVFSRQLTRLLNLRAGRTR